MISVTDTHVVVDEPEMCGTLDITVSGNTVGFRGRLTGVWLVDRATGDSGYSDINYRFVSVGGSRSAALAGLMTFLGKIIQEAEDRRDADQLEFWHDLVRAAWVTGQIDDDEGIVR